MGSEESTREEVRCGGNEDVNGWMSGGTKLDRIRNEIIRGTTKVHGRNFQESRLKWYGHLLRREVELRRRQKSGGDGGAGEKKKRKTEEEVVGQHQERFVGENS